MSGFEIYITPKGPVLIEGEQKLKVLDAIMREKSQFGDIVADTGIAKSSVSVVLKKLAEAGIISADGEGNDKRFHPLALRMIASMEQDKIQLVNLMRGWAADSGEIKPSHVEAIMAGYLIIEAHRHGFTFSPMMVEDVRMLAHVAYEKVKDIDCDHLALAIDFINRIGFVHVDTVSKFPPTFDISLRPNTTEYTRIMIIMVVSRFLTEYLSLVTGSSLKLSVLEKIGEDTAHIQMGYTDIRPEFSGRMYHDIEFEETGVSEFAIYQTNGTYIPVSDEMELRILKCMEKHPYSSRDLMGELKEPQTTILGHLKKMEETHILMSQKSGNRSIYFLSAEKLLAWKRPENGIEFNGRKYLELIWETPEHFIQLMTCFIVADAKDLGFDISALMTYLGNRIGEMIMDIVPGVTAETLFSVIQKESKRFTASEIVLKSYNPPTVFRLSDYDMDQTIADAQRVFYDALFATIFGKLMHVPFVVKEDRISGEGFRRYEASFIPKIN